MGIYLRRDSKYWWSHLERPGQKPVQESTRVLHDAKSATLRKHQEQLARDIYISRMNDLARSRHQLPSQRTIAFRLHADWYETHVLPTHRGAERETAALKPLRAFFADEDLLTITAARVAEYVTHRTVKPGTINREIDVLKALLKAAVPRYLPVSPLVGLKKQRTVKIPKRVLSPAEEARLLDVLQPDDRALYIVAVDTLIRLSNVVHLTRAENKGAHLALVDSKTGPYTVPLSTRARLALAGLPNRGVYYFPRRRGVKQPRNGIRLMLKAACRRAGLPYGRAVAGVTWHTGTRATGATRMLRAGVDPKTVQAIGHWASLEQMGEYLQTNTPLMQAAVNQIGRDVLTSDLRGKRKRAKQARKSA